MDNFRKAPRPTGRKVTLPVSDSAATPAPAPKRGRFVKITTKLQATSWRQRILLGVGALVVSTGLFFGIKVALATRHIIAKSNGGAPALNGNLDLTQLKGEGDGRINILLLGIGGKGWDGPYLSDTIMVASIDPRTKEVALLSIPRDLYVNITGTRTWSKINAADAFGEENKAGGGPILAEKTVESILGIPIHYYVRVDFSGFKKAVDTVGGVDINVQKALYDPYYPGTTVNFKPGLQHMNGNLALQYARSRKTTSDFDRAARQQQILVALKQKAFSINTIANPAKLSGLIDAFGDSVRTDMQLSEMKKLMTIIQGIDSSKISSKVLDTSPGGLLMDGSGKIPGAGSIELPAAGIGNYGAIQAYAHSIFADSYIKDENATIDIQNGTVQSGLATSVSTLLKSYNYNVVTVTTAAQQNYAHTVIYDYTGGKKPYTINYLENRFGVKSQKMTRGPSDPDIRIIVGADYKAPRSTY